MTTDSTALPRHIAIIMDGNNRWARSKGLPTKSGHRQGAEAARDIVNSCINREIPYLTLFAFSSENWMRPASEVNALMALFLMVLKRREINQFHRANVRFRFVGKRTDFSSKIIQSMEEAERLTANNTGTTVIVAADYGGRWDITKAAQKLAEDVKQGIIQPEDIDVEAITRNTCLGDIPDPDLCIRTGGEKRISNFLLWNFAYTEFHFADCYWPEFNDAAFQAALDDYMQRQRRFGKHDE